MNPSHPWDSQIPRTNVGASGLADVLPTEAFHSLPVVNCTAFAFPMAHVMQKNLDSIACMRFNHIVNFAWKDGTLSQLRAFELVETLQPD
jgi:hypothetical protein